MIARRSLAAIGIIALALGACSMEPKYVRTDSPVPGNWPVGDAYLRSSEAALPSYDWHDVFADLFVAQQVAELRRHVDRRFDEVMGELQTLRQQRRNAFEMPEGILRRLVEIEREEADVQAPMRGTA